MVRKNKATTSWNDVKLKLADFDRSALHVLVQDLYAVSNDNQAFLHARLNLGDDTLKPYKATLTRWLSPDIFKNQDTSVAKAKKAIADYKKAIGRPEELAELMTFYCEQAVDFSKQVSLQDDGYYSALVRMYAQALEVVVSLPKVQCDAFMKRLDQVRDIGRKLGYGVDFAMDELFFEYQRGE